MSLAFQALVLRALRNAAAIVRVIATIGLLGLLQAIVLKRYGAANQPVDALPARRRLRVGRHHRPGGADLPRRHHPRGDHRRSGPGPGTPGSAWPSTPAPRTSGRCRPSGGPLTAWRRSPGPSAGCSAGSPRCSPPRSPACRRPPSRSWSPWPAWAPPCSAASSPSRSRCSAGLIIGVGESMATLYGNDITDFLGQDLISGLNRMPGVPRDLPGGGRPRAAACPCGPTIAERLPRLGTGEISIRGVLVASADRPRPPLRGDGRVVGPGHLHLARHRGDGAVDRRPDRLRGPDLARPVGPRRHRRPDRRPLRARRPPGRAGDRPGRPADHPGRAALRRARLADPRGEPGRGHPRPRVHRVRGGLRQPQLPGRRTRRRDPHRPGEAVRDRGRRRQPPPRLGRGQPRRLRAPGPAGRQPAPLAHRPAAHRRADERARRRVARHLGVRGQALRVRRLGRPGRRGRDPGRVPGPARSPTPSSTSSPRSTASATPSSAASATCSAPSSPRPTPSAASAPASSRTGSVWRTSGTSSWAPSWCS